MKTPAFFILLLTVGLVLFGCKSGTTVPDAETATAPQQAQPETPVDSASLKPMPEFELEKLTGGTLKSSELQGKIAIIDFWATWCAPCISEIPNYNELAAKYADKGVVLVGMTVQSGSIDEVKPKVAEFNMKYPVVMGNDEVEEGFGGTIGYPTTFIVNQDGKIYKKILGIVSKKREVLEKHIETLLATGAKNTEGKTTKVY
jgi:thiol-disulfide isomerase/thioredoxin